LSFVEMMEGGRHGHKPSLIVETREGGGSRCKPSPFAQQMRSANLHRLSKRKVVVVGETLIVHQDNNRRLWPWSQTSSFVKTTEGGGGDGGHETSLFVERTEGGGGDRRKPLLAPRWPKRRKVVVVVGANLLVRRNDGW
jgi:hypothetical protein